MSAIDMNLIRQAAAQQLGHSQPITPVAVAEPPVWETPDHTEHTLESLDFMRSDEEAILADEMMRHEVWAAQQKEQIAADVVAASAVPVVPQPDLKGEFATPADGAKFMAGMYGIPQIPLQGKKPFFNDWQDKGSVDFAQIDAWAAKHTCNFGSVAKSNPNGHFVLEVDSTDVIVRAKQDGVKFSSEVIIQSRPGRGHRWYNHSDESLLIGNIQQADRGCNLPGFIPDEP
jgi:bifunctional DNA primase/polymerase-like protein